MKIGYALSSEEHTPLDLVRNAVRAEEVGFPFALVSDHFHPWIDHQTHATCGRGVAVRLGLLRPPERTWRCGACRRVVRRGSVCRCARPD